MLVLRDRPDDSDDFSHPNKAENSHARPAVQGRQCSIWCGPVLLGGRHDRGPGGNYRVQILTDVGDEFVWRNNLIIVLLERYRIEAFRVPNQEAVALCSDRAREDCGHHANGHADLT